MTTKHMITTTCIVLSLVLSQVARADIGAAQRVSAPTAVQTTDSPLTKLMDWLPGDYSNLADALLANSRAAQGTGASSPDPYLETYIRQVKIPAIGQNILFLEEYRGREKPTLERVRLYSLRVNSAGDRVNILVLNPKDPDSLAGARHDLSKVQTLGPEDLIPDSEGCTLTFIARDERSVVGRMKHHGCSFKDQWVDYEMHVSSERHWVCYSRRTLADDFVIWQLIPGLPCTLMNRN